MPSALHVINVEAAIYRTTPNGQNEWLMIERSAEEEHAAGTISMVGGTVDHEDADVDTLESALRREVKEEVDITVGALTYVRSSAFVAKEHVVDVVYLCPHESGEPRAVDASEVAAIGWMSLSQILEHPKAMPWTRDSMLKATEVLAAQTAAQ